MLLEKLVFKGGGRLIGEVFQRSFTVLLGRPSEDGRNLSFLSISKQQHIFHNAESNTMKKGQILSILSKHLYMIIELLFTSHKQ